MRITTRPAPKTTYCPSAVPNSSSASREASVWRARPRMATRSTSAARLPLKTTRRAFLRMSPSNCDTEAADRLVACA
ncbi:hypothetical protein D3C73_806800 [compost metagenome]